MSTVCCVGVGPQGPGGSGCFQSSHLLLMRFGAQGSYFAFLEVFCPHQLPTQHQTLWGPIPMPCTSDS
eukprot:1723186-Amphidinium_carterae.1